MPLTAPTPRAISPREDRFVVFHPQEAQEDLLHEVGHVGGRIPQAGGEKPAQFARVGFLYGCDESLAVFVGHDGRAGSL
jgi:hypothetical protein